MCRCLHKSMSLLGRQGIKSGVKHQMRCPRNKCYAEVNFQGLLKFVCLPIKSGCLNPQLSEKEKLSFLYPSLGQLLLLTSIILRTCSLQPCFYVLVCTDSSFWNILAFPHPPLYTALQFVNPTLPQGPAQMQQFLKYSLMLLARNDLPLL